MDTRTYAWRNGTSTGLFVVVQGVLVGLGGLAHGLFETLQGNTPTGGYWQAFGFFSILPTYLLTGLAAIIVSLGLIAWTIGCIHTKHGPTVFVVISILLFTVGGGVAQILFFVVTWAAAIQLHSPLAGWEKVLAPDWRKPLARLWAALWISGYGFLFAAIGIWLFLTPPTVAYHAPTATDYSLWTCLLVGIIFQPLTVISGFARDIERQTLAQS